MEPADHVNREVLWAGLFWALILHLARSIALRLLALPQGQPVQQLVAGGLFFIAYLLYPTLLTFVMQGQTPVWINPTIHATAGSLLMLFGLLLLSAATAALWIYVAVTALGIWLLLGVLLPWVRATRWLKQERNRAPGVWKRLADLSLSQWMLLQVPKLRSKGKRR